MSEEQQLHILPLKQLRIGSTFVLPKTLQRSRNRAADIRENAGKPYWRHGKKPAADQNN